MTRRHLLEISQEGTLYYLLNAFIGAYNRRTDVLARQANGSDAQKLNTIIDMLSPLGSTPATLGLMETRLETIHALLADLVTADPEKIKQITASVKAIREKLKTSVDQQQVDE